MRTYYEIKSTDVEQPFINMFGRVHSVSSFLGRVLQQDVGKRCYLVNDVIQVENKEQFDKRTTRQ